jgi:alpha-amylase/alpha-mannosidase (GH57 family)
MIWANFLHIYQPPTQKEFWIKKIANESYRPLVRGLLANPAAKITLNINAVLTELFVKHGGQDIIDGLRTLAERGQLEFTGSAKYHPFLPLMPESEIRRQIDLNTETNKKHFGSVYQPRGFFPPEMAYNRKVADVARSMGFNWLIIDELAHSGKMQSVHWDRVYTLTGADDFFIFFRDRDISFRILSAEVGVSVFSAGMMLKTLGDRLKSDEFLLTAMDGETFGHHRPGLDTLLFELYQVPEIESVTMSEIPNRITKRETVEPLPSTWALMRKDLEQKLPYSRWFDESNEIHQLQWELTNAALATIQKLSPTDPAFPAVRASLDRAIHSDQYWWASASPWWSIEMIEAGAKDLKDTIEANPAETAEIKEQARALYQKIIYTAFDWQRTDKISGMIKAADEDVTQRITREMPHIPLEEFETMVRNLETQMETAAKSREYERAAQLRDRVQELQSKKLDITGSA